MRYFNVSGYDRPLLLSEEHAQLLGAAEVRELPTPSKSATRQAWADYAVSQGVPPEAVETQTRAQLIETYGG